MASPAKRHQGGRLTVLLTTTSYQDTPGSHHQLLADRKDITVRKERGPLSEATMLGLVGEVDALLCGDDGITRAVMERGLPRLKVISKYGIGLDKIDLSAARELNIPVLYTPGVNHTTVAEHTLCLLLALQRSFVEEANFVRQGQWKRITGHEIAGKTLGVVGMGRIGKEVMKRAAAFDMKVIGYGESYWDETFAVEKGVERCGTLKELLSRSDVVSLHTKLTPTTTGMLNVDSIAGMKDGAYVVNTSRGQLVDTDAMVNALASGKLGGYGADVLDEEPPPKDHPLLQAKNCIITPHIGSRTFENVVRQATMATENMLLFLDGKTPLARAV